MEPANGKIYAVSGASMSRILQENHIRKALGEINFVELRDVTAMIVLEPSVAEVVVGNTVTLKASVLPEGSTVTWASSATGKATVSNKGVVSGVASGSTVITASITVGGTTYKDVCNVTVNAAPVQEAGT